MNDMADYEFNKRKAKEDTFTVKEEYSVEELLAIMEYLRSEVGCPWDRVQTHDSVKNNMLEEAYEVIDAIMSGSPERLADELGDVLLQVIFHAQMAQESGDFSFEDVVGKISRKLISRHTHIFGHDEAEDPDAVLRTWDKNKKLEKGLRRQTDVLRDVPRSLPALMRAYKLQKKAAQVGFDWKEPEGALEKIHEELAEIDEVRTRRGAEKRELEAEAGDFLFAAVNYVRLLGIEPEVALSRCSDRFVDRFAAMEDKAEKDKLVLKQLTLDEWEELWVAAKEKLRAKEQEQNG